MQGRGVMQSCLLLHHCVLSVSPFERVQARAELEERLAQAGTAADIEIRQIRDERDGLKTELSAERAKGEFLQEEVRQVSKPRWRFGTIRSRTCRLAGEAQRALLAQPVHRNTANKAADDCSWSGCKPGH